MRTKGRRMKAKMAMPMVILCVLFDSVDELLENLQKELEGTSLCDKQFEKGLLF